MHSRPLPSSILNHRSARRLLGYALLAAGLLLLPTVASAAPSLDDGSPAPGMPCGLTGHRQIDRLIVEEGEEIEVDIDYRYACSRQRRQINFFLLVEATEALRGNGVHRSLFNNLKQAMTDFVHRVDYDHGSMGGLTFYAQDYSNRLILRGGDAGKVALLRAIRSISVEPIGNSAGAPAAIRDATGRLPTSTQIEATNVLIVVDAGAPVSTRPLIDYATACGAAHKAGVVLIVIGLENAGSRGLGCASPGWGRISREKDGSDLSEIFEGLADTLISGKRAELDEYADWLDQGFTYVPGSASPFEPDTMLRRQHVWSFDRPAPTGVRSIRYRIQAETGLGNRITPLSVESTVDLILSDGSRARVDLDNPEICVHKPGQAEFCTGHGQDPPNTPTTPPPSPEPSTVPPSPTVVPPSPEPTSTPQPATPTDSPRPAPNRILYLPISWS